METNENVFLINVFLRFPLILVQQPIPQNTQLSMPSLNFLASNFKRAFQTSILSLDLNSLNNLFVRTQPQDNTLARLGKGYFAIFRKYALTQLIIIPKRKLFLSI